MLSRRILPLMLSALLPSLAFAQHLSERAQWQPQASPTDSRLDQPVEIEIFGRAAVPALAMLSQQTGVSLGVAPEDVNTVGERKVTIVSRGLPLRAIIVQLPGALREAHWDIADHDGQLAYVLHRNSGAQATMTALRQRDRSPEGVQARARARRSNRLKAARRALEMSPAELEGLEQADILLARAVRDSISRPAMEALLSLPGDKMDLLVSAGEAEITFDEASAWLQDIARTDLRLNRTEEWQARDGSEFAPGLAAELLSAVRFAFRFELTGVNLILRHGSEPDSHAWSVVIAVPASSLPPGCEQRAERLLIRSGTPEEEARQIVRGLTERWQEGPPAAAELEPATQPDSQLTYVMRLDCAERLDLTEVQRIIARRADLSIISDYFTTRPCEIPEDVRHGLPIWQLLEQLCASADYEWLRVGRCLVLNHRKWYEMVREEVPEAVLVPYREKLEDGQDLSPRELVAIARNVYELPCRERELVPPEERYAHKLADSFALWALGLCDPITEEQASALFAPEGLQFCEMREDQQAQFLAEIRSWKVADEALQSPEMLALHIRALTLDREGTLQGSVRIHASFRKKACGGTSLQFRLPYPPALCRRAADTAE